LSEKWSHKSYNGKIILFREIPYEGKIGVIKKNSRIKGVSGIHETDKLFELLVNNK